MLGIIGCKTPTKALNTPLVTTSCRNTNVAPWVYGRKPWDCSYNNIATPVVNVAPWVYGWKNDAPWDCSYNNIAAPVVNEVQIHLYNTPIPEEMILGWHSLLKHSYIIWPNTRTHITRTEHSQPTDTRQLLTVSTNTSWHTRQLHRSKKTGTHTRALSYITQHNGNVMYILAIHYNKW